MNTLLKKKPSKVPPGAKKKKPAAKMICSLHERQRKKKLSIMKGVFYATGAKIETRGKSRNCKAISERGNRDQRGKPTNGREQRNYPAMDSKL
nr:hypothetical protein [uncultured Oscillibacter sp.]